MKSIPSFLRRTAPAALFVLTILCASGARAAVYTVVSLGDGNDGSCDIGNCTLREALLAANAHAGADTIAFDLAGPPPYLITLASALPSLTEAVLIDGFSEPDFISTPVVEISGLSLPGSQEWGILVMASGCTVRGLAIGGFSGDGIYVYVANDITIEGNHLGVNAAGTAVRANGRAGVDLLAVKRCAITGNLISGNGEQGIFIYGNPADLAAMSDITIAGNRIGTNLAGTAALPNGKGISAQDVSNLVIGGTEPGRGNLISGNSSSGVELFGGSLTATLIQGNLIGVNDSGTAALANNGDGIKAYMPELIIGGTESGAANVISGNTSFGIELRGPDAVIAGNLVGVAANGTTALGNHAAGIYISDAGAGTVIGGSDPAAGNVVSGNWWSGIYAYATGPVDVDIRILNNRIGTDGTGQAAVPNSWEGVFDANIAGLRIGEAGAGNLISGNGRSGIKVDFSQNRAYLGVFVQGNRIGTDAAGLLALPNQQSGVEITYGVQGMTVGGEAAGQGNLISGNLGAGILFGTSVEYILYSTIYGNTIGLNAAGAPLGNGSHGIHVDGYALKAAVGGTAPGQANEIARNGGAGVRIENYWVFEMAVVGNSIHDNGGLGIDLYGAGVTPNDYRDSDRGSNEQQNFPVLAEARQGTGSLVISGLLETAPFQRTRLDFYGSPAADPSGYGEGAWHLGTAEVRTDFLGQAPVALALPSSLPAGTVITATAADSVGNTSEFSAAVSSTAASLQADLQVAFVQPPDTLIVGREDPLRVEVSNSGPDPTAGVSLALQLTGDLTVTAVNSPRGTFTIDPGLVTCDLGFVLPGESLVVEVTLLPGSAGAWSATAAVTGNESDPQTADNQATHAGLAISSADAWITQSAPPFLGEAIPFDLVLTIGNGGPSLAPRISMVDTLNIDFEILGLTFDAEVCSCGSDAGAWGSRVVCAVYDLPAGQTTEVVVNGSFANPGSYLNVARVQTNVHDPDPANNQAARMLEVLPPGQTDFALTATSSSYTVVRNQNMVLHAVVANLGPATAASEAEFAIGPLFAFVGAIPTAGTAVYDPVLETVRWSLPALTPGASEGLDLTLMGNEVRRGTVTGLVTTAMGDPVPDNDAIDQWFWIKPVPTLVVNTQDDIDDGVCDGGHCSLREAINAANAAADRDIIGFAIPDTGAIVITPATPLPQLTQPVVLDGSYQPTYRGTPVIGLSGELIDPITGGRGVILSTDNSTVRGLVVGAFPSDGLYIYGDQDTMAGNYSGLDQSGSGLWSNEGHGLVVHGQGAVVGGLHPEDRNVLSGNGIVGYKNGLFLMGSPADPLQCSNVQVVGNYLGTTADGNTALGNGNHGIEIYHCSAVKIGGTSPGARNVLSGNRGSGIRVSGDNCAGIDIWGNRIGTDPTGSFAVPNQGNGVDVAASTPGVSVGSSVMFSGNLISGNGWNGIATSGVGTIIQGNIIGMDPNAAAPLPNDRAGIAVTSSSVSARDILIGGTHPRTRNYIAANGQDGISVWSGLTHDVSIAGNYIGTDRTGTVAVPNALSGVAIHEASAVVIGGALDTQRNLLSGNGQAGIEITGVWDVQDSLIVQGNYIGTAADGSTALGNGLAGIYLHNEAKRLTVGGNQYGEGNVIAGNGGPGIWAGQTVGWIHSLDIRHNLIGLDIHGQALPNAGHGIWLETYVRDSAIGDGTLEGANHIAFHEGDGIRIQDHASFGIAMLGNMIYQNTGMAIDLELAGPNPNDPLDVDRGANEQQNFPVLSGAALVAEGVRVGGSLNAYASTAYRLDFYADTAADPSGYGEARYFLGSLPAVVTDGLGNATFEEVFVLPDPAATVVSATATDPNGNTSELSLCFPVFDPSGVETPELPLAFRLGPAAPNPFNPMTSIAFDLPQPSLVDLRIFDLRGRLVRTLLREEPFPAGSHRTVWNGTDQGGRTVAAGSYVIVIQCGDFRGTRKVQLVK